MQRFFLSSISFQKNHLKIIDQNIIHQIKHVLRLKNGDHIIVLDSSGQEYFIKLTNISNPEITGDIIKQQKNQAEPDLKVNLWQAVPKQLSRFEYVLQKGTEIGIHSFIPMITERTEVPFLKKKERLQSIIREAAEQSGRGIMPKLENEIKLTDIFKKPPIGRNVMPYEAANSSMAETNKLLPELIKINQVINIFIGPEGGFSNQEVNQAKMAGFDIISLGPRILRTETAGIVLGSLLIYR